MNKANIEVQKGNFSTWMENFERQQRLEMQQNERLKKEIVRMKGSQGRRKDGPVRSKLQKRRRG